MGKRLGILSFFYWHLITTTTLFTSSLAQCNTTQLPLAHKSITPRCCPKTHPINEHNEHPQNPTPYYNSWPTITLHMHYSTTANTASGLVLTLLTRSLGLVAGVLPTKQRTSYKHYTGTS